MGQICGICQARQDIEIELDQIDNEIQDAWDLCIDMEGVFEDRIMFLHAMERELERGPALCECVDE
uniref:Uncharacterized protein n=1 Tax=uncultured prokaryote TaxID=198431 RepID=A0A0H5QLB3_9ZZZZ|nr:hypothetical protein [uncultured prokaryote]